MQSESEGRSIRIDGDGNVIGDNNQTQVINADGSSVVIAGPVTFNVTGIDGLAPKINDFVSSQQKRGDVRGGEEADSKAKSAKPLPARQSSDSHWTVETPTVATGILTEFFSGTVYPKEARMIYAGGYEVVMTFTHSHDSQPRIVLMKDGLAVDPIVDFKSRVLRFPKGTVWMTDNVVMPLEVKQRTSSADQWFIEPPGFPLSQQVRTYFGDKQVYIEYETVFEGGYRVIAALNPSKTREKPVEVFFYHKDEQVQPILNYDRKSASFPVR